MRSRLRAWVWATGAVFLVFGFGSTHRAWRSCDRGWPTNFWGAIQPRPLDIDLDDWLPGGACSVNFRPTAILFGVTVVAGIGVYAFVLWLCRAMRPEVPGEVLDYGEFPMQ
jgi:hypothetical protein